MGSEQSSDCANPMISETANFDFRDKPRRKGMLRETYKSRDKFGDQKKNSRCWENVESNNINYWHVNKSVFWLEEGMDVVKKMEKEGRGINLSDAGS